MAPRQPPNAANKRGIVGFADGASIQVGESGRTERPLVLARHLTEAVEAVWHAPVVVVVEASVGTKADEAYVGISIPSCSLARGRIDKTRRRTHSRPRKRRREWVWPSSLNRGPSWRSLVVLG